MVVSLISAVIEGDATTLAAVAPVATPDERQRAMEAALHWGDAECVRALMPCCDVAAALAFVDVRDGSEPEGLHTQPEVLALLLADRLEAHPVECDSSPPKRSRL